MALRSETISVGAAREVAAGIYGFVVDRSDVGAEFPLVATVEYDNGEQWPLTVYEGRFYSTLPRARTLTLGTASGSTYNYVLTRASHTDDVVVQGSPPPSPTTLLASWRSYGSTGAASFQSIRMPPGVVGLMWLTVLKTFAAVTSLTGLLDLDVGGSTLRMARQIAAAAANQRAVGVWGGNPSATTFAVVSGDSTTTGMNASPYVVTALPIGGSFPPDAITQIGIYDAGITNRWDTDVYAIGAGR